MKKRILLVLMAILVVVVFAFVSCNNNDGDGDSGSTDTNTGSTNTDTGSTDTNTGSTPDPNCQHVWGEWETTVAPTCRDNGQQTQTCTKCPATNTQTIIASDDYCDFSVKDVKPANCATGAQGEEKWVCSVCGDTDPSRNVIYTDAEHTPGEWVEEPAKCGVAGYKYQKCEVCYDEALALGMLNYEVLPALEHDWKTLSSEPATCETAEVLHQQCSVCEDTIDVEGEPLLGHNYENQPELTAAPTCTESGYKYKLCANNCGKEQVTGVGEPSSGHTYVYEDPNYSVRVEATCITDGSVTATCKVCGHVGTSEQDGIQILPADPSLHYNTYNVDSEHAATCHTDAYAVWSCTKDAACTETKNVYSEGTKLNHVWEQKGEPVPSTCVLEGYTLMVCTICEDADGAENCDYGCWDHRDKQPKADHKMSVVHENTRVDSTCINPSTVDYECQYCDGYYTYTYPIEGEGAVPLKEHGDWRRTDNVVAPTCTSEGWTVYECSRDEACTETIDQEYTMRSEHQFVVYADGRLVCPTCEVTYRNITTYQEDPIASSGDEGNGPLVFEDAEGNKIELDWEVIGYGKPATPTAITAQTPYTQNEFKLPMAQGVVAVKLVDNMEITLVVDGVTYAITAEYNDLHSYYNVTITRGDYEYKYETVNASIYVDLYVNETVTEITVTSNVDTTIELYAKQ